MQGFITKRAKHLWIVAAAVLGLFALVVAFRSGSRQPSYHGHPLAYWFQRLPLTWKERVNTPGRVYGSQYEEADAAVLAIEAIGTNGLPFLMHKLQRHPVPFQQWAQAWIYRCGIKREFFPNPELERSQAVRALMALAPLPPEVVLRLRSLSQTSTNSVGFAAASVLKVNANPSSKPFLGRPW